MKTKDQADKALKEGVMASEIIKELLRCIIEAKGDLPVDISVAKQSENKAIEQQQYLKAEARFIIVEVYKREQEPYEEEKRISIRDWPY